MSYLEIITRYGELARQKREVDAPTVISTFAGGGGSSTGYHMAGFRELAAFDFDEDSVLTLKRNYPNVKVVRGDITLIDPLQVLRDVGLEVGELDALDGSPPCQGFSLSGKKDPNDPRNLLYRDFSYWIKSMQPKCFVMENVPSMANKTNRHTFKDVLAYFSGAGYQVAWKVMDASLYRVPQKRKRMIVIGIRNDLGTKPTFPNPMQSFNVRDAFAGLPAQKADYRIKQYLIDAYEFMPAFASQPYKVKLLRANGYKGLGSNLNKADWGRPAPTITKTSSAFNGCLHPSEPRWFTLAELKRIGSFPDWYEFTDRSKGNSRIGNSVPPLLTEAIATHLRKIILDL